MAANPRQVRLLRAARFLPALAWMGFIFLMSALPNLSVPETPGGWSPPERPVKKVAHLVEYSVLGLLLCWGMGKPNRRRVASAAAIAALYALSDELHQAWVPTRHPRLFDVCVDTCGGLIGAMIWWLRGRRASKTAGGG